MKFTHPTTKSYTTTDRDVVFIVEGGIVDTVQVFVQGREVPPLSYNSNSVTVFLPTTGKFWVRLIINGKTLPTRVITIK